MPTITFLRRLEVESRTGKKRSTIYKSIQDGTIPPPVAIGARAVAWPAHEIDAINQARVAGQSDDEIRQLVIELVERRKQVATTRSAA